MRTWWLLATAALGACVITRPPLLAERPRWQVVGDDAYAGGCVTARAFVRKSGKQGIGVALQLRSRGDCRVELAGQLQLPGFGVATIAPPPPIEMRGHSQLYAWLPIHFDGDAAWNADAVDARIVLAVTANGTPAPPWAIAIHEAMQPRPVRRWP